MSPPRTRHAPEPGPDRDLRDPGSRGDRGPGTHRTPTGPGLEHRPDQNKEDPRGTIGDRKAPDRPKTPGDGPDSRNKGPDSKPGPRAPGDRIRTLPRRPDEVPDPGGKGKRAPPRDGGPLRPDDDWFDPGLYNSHGSVSVGYRGNHSRYYDYHYYYPDWCVDFGYYSGFSFGFVFCQGCVGPCGHVSWYYRYPGYKACYYPYRFYYRPSCYYLPSYYTVYSTVRYVTEYVDDVEYYPALPASEPIDPALELDELMTLGWKLFRNRDYPGAAEAFRQAILLAPEDPWARFAFAQGLFAIGNYPDAAFVLRRGMQLLPNWPLVGENPLTRYGDHGDHTEQLLALRTFLEYLPDDPSGLLMLGVQSYFTGDLTTARLVFHRLLDMDSSDRVALGFADAMTDRR